MRRLFWLGGFASVGLIALLTVTGTSLIPASIWLGPCLYDWTSTVSLHPRQSSMAELHFRAGAVRGELCYGRPSARGRDIYGALVPWRQIWRLGANEPTRLYLNRPASVAGITVPSGRYSMYVAPDSTRWTLYLSRSVLHWGNDISPAVRAREVGHAELSISHLALPVDTFTASTATSADTITLQFDWASTRLSIPIIPLR